MADHTSFRSAAEHAARSQSAVSAQIKQLEEQLGVQLFHRTTRSVRLTTEGEQLLASVRRGLHEIRDGLRKIDETVDLRRGKVSLGCSPTIAGSRLPEALALFSNDYPDVQLIVREMLSTELLESIRKHDVDFGIGPITEDSDFSFLPILTEEMYALAHRDLYRAARSSIRLQELVGMPILLLNAPSALRAQVEQNFEKLGLEISTNYHFSQMQTIIAAAKIGLGVAILPKIALPQVPLPELQELRIFDPVMTRQIAIVTLKGDVLSPAASRLAALLPVVIGAEPRRTSPPKAASRRNRRLR